MKATSIKFELSTQRRLKELAHRTNRSQSWLIRQAVDEYLDRREEE